MDLSKFNKINRSQKKFEIRDENTGYEAKGLQQNVSGGGFGISFSMTSEFVSESDPRGLFPLLGKSFDEILSFGNNYNSENTKSKLSKKDKKAIEYKNELPELKKNSEEKSFFQSVCDYWLK
jgi:hypothetical protein